MDILHLVGRSHRRGAERVALELAKELDALGHRNRILAVGLGHEGDRDDALPPLVDDRRLGGRQVLRAATRFRAVLRTGSPDVVMAHGATPALVAVLASPRRGPALVWQRILTLADGSLDGVRGLCWRVAVRRMDGVVALTEPQAGEVRTLGYRGPVWQIPNGRRTQRFQHLDHQSAALDLRAELGLGTDVGLVGLVGYLVDQKRPLRAVEVLGRLRLGGVDAHLVVVGSGPLADAVRRDAHRRDLTPHLSLLGHRDDVAPLLAGLDVVILTSDDEGVPGVVVEAAMAGCPVVTYPVGSVADVVQDQVTGIVLAQASTEAMAEEVGSLLADADRRQTMATAARARSEAFSMETIARRYGELLVAVTRGAAADR